MSFGPRQAAQLEKLWWWARRFSLRGPGVRFTNTEDTFAAWIEPPPGTSISPSKPQLQARMKATTWSDSSALGPTLYRARIVSANVSSLDPTATPTDAGLFTDGDTDVLAINKAEFGFGDRLLDPPGGQVTFDVTFLGTIQTAGTFQGVAVYSFFGFNPGTPCNSV